MTDLFDLYAGIENILVARVRRVMRDRGLLKEPMGAGEVVALLTEAVMNMPEPRPKTWPIPREIYEAAKREIWENDPRLVAHPYEERPGAALMICGVEMCPS